MVNARVGIRGPDERWALELWAQNMFNKDYAQVAFNSPFQEGATGAPFADPQFPGGRQIFSAYLAEPRTYGLTLRGRFSAPRRAPEPYIAPPAAARAGSRDADLPRRQRHPGDRHVPGYRPAAGPRARTRLGFGTSIKGLAIRRGPFSLSQPVMTALSAARRPAIAARVKFPPVASGDVKDVDRALAIGRDMRRMDRVAARMDRIGEPRQQPGPVARIDLDHRGSGRRLFGDQHRRRDREHFLAARQGRFGRRAQRVLQSARSSPRRPAGRGAARRYSLCRARR